MIPTENMREDGRRYTINRVFDIRQAVAMKAGWQGHRYIIRVHGSESYLYIERSENLAGNNIGR